ncbi:hypothetical protein BN2476_720011 [Paraburkholderia piptadeniae]|uniref:Uncharacterized protein n=1 Tax=Paraburkholderia piptadeniae TaxID=1701573 RepID=A0A1N7SQV5_9BURK|nr:hypothetical protein BN2476_720011 [Paraburkholderia piptadeniae]
MLTHCLAQIPDRATVLIDAGHAGFIDRERHDTLDAFGGRCDGKSPSSVCAGQSRLRRKGWRCCRRCARWASDGDKAKGAARASTGALAGVR